MAKNSRSHTPVLLFLFLFLGVFVAACEQGEMPLDAAPPSPGSILIEAGAEGASAWTLVAPDGSEVQGAGDSLITVPVEGEYWLLWEPVEAWHSPQDNPYRLSYKRGDITEIQAKYEPIDGGMGALRVDPQLNGAAAAWNIHGPNGFFAAGRGKKTMNKRATGAYIVIWESVDGFITPPQTAGQLDDDGVLTLNADYQPVSSGAGEIDIRFLPEGLNGPWQLVNADGGSWAGQGALTLPSMPVGDYTLNWGPVDGYEAPAPQTASLVDGERIVFLGEYVDLPDPIGTIIVDVTPDGVAAEWVLTSEAGARFAGTGDRRLEGIPSGVWTLTPAPVAGYITPATTSVQLATGWEITWDVNYVRDSSPMGTLVIDPNPDELNAPWQLLSSAGIVSSGSGDQTLENIPVGDYQVQWGEVEGYATPELSAVSIADGQTVTALSTYEAVAAPLGTVVIDPNPDSLNAPWQITLPGGEIMSGTGDQTLVDMALGDYTLTWGDVEGWETPTPNPVTLTLGAGGTALFSMR
jgi:hypothetical protein